MRVVFAGSRGLRLSDEDVNEIVESSKWLITELVSGHATGVDRCGEAWAKARGIDVKIFLADWGKHGRKAGPIRNNEMAAYADAVIAVWDNQSRGTANMIHEAEWQNKPVLIFYRPEIGRDDQP